MEIQVPIVVNNVHVKDCIIGPINFQNIVVPNCPQYVIVDSDTPTYSRTIQRINSGQMTWPPHPTNEYGRILGAIVLIKSIDDMYLLVKNGNLWGLPKGARNYPNFLKHKEITDKHYLDTGTVYVHEILTVTPPESSLDNVIREALEETGIVIDPTYLYEFTSDNSHYTAYDRYVYEYPHTVREFIANFDKQSKHMDSENDSLMWTSKENVFRMVQDQTRDRYKKLLNQVSLRFLYDFLY
jgi:8-oxo-dGTP pyrophosphatase MutT (NUDIX family)